MLLHYPLHVSLILAESSLGILELVGEVEEKGGIAGNAAVKGAHLLSLGVRNAAARETFDEYAVAPAAGASTHLPDIKVIWLFCGAGCRLGLPSPNFGDAQKERKLAPGRIIATLFRCIVLILLPTALALRARGPALCACATGNWVRTFGGNRFGRVILDAWDGHSRCGETLGENEQKRMKPVEESETGVRPQRHMSRVRDRLARGVLHTAVATKGPAMDAEPTVAPSLFHGFAMH